MKKKVVRYQLKGVNVLLDAYINYAILFFCVLPNIFISM